MVIYKGGLSAPIRSGEKVVLALAPRGRKTLTEEIEAGRLPQGVYVATSGAYRRALRLRAYALIPFAAIAEVASGPNPAARPPWWRFWSKWSPFVLILKLHAGDDVVFEWVGDWKGNTLARVNAVREDFAAIVSAFGEA